MHQFTTSKVAPPITNGYSFERTVLLTAMILLGTICVVNLFVLGAYLFHSELPQGLFVFAVIASLALPFLFVSKLGFTTSAITLPVTISVGVLSLSLLASWFYFDLSWDGQWYQQAAVYNLAKGWNPLFNPLVTPDHTDNTSILHFPKSTWYFGAAVLQLFGTVEMGKAYNFTLLFAAFGVVYPFCRSLNLSKGRSTIFTLLVLFNPVVWSEVTTYLNDGDLYLLLVIYLTAIILWLSDAKPIYLVIAIMAICCLVNTKFTGLVFFLISALFLFVYVIIRHRQRVKPFLLSHLLAGMLAIGVFGFNPYITNTIQRGHPLYPLMGTLAYPSVFASGKDSNEAYETPHNMQGQSLPVRLFYANFGQPGNAPYNHEKFAILVNPFNTDTAHWTAYHYHETRVSGFGPYFGISLILMLVALPLVLWGEKRFWLPTVLFMAALICCLSLSQHFWWPRFFPMLWLAPLLPLLLKWNLEATSQSNPIIRFAFGWLPAALLCLNGLIVATVHMRWETNASISLRRDLQQLQNDNRPIEIRYGSFKRSIEEKLKYWDIRFKPVKLKRKDPTVHKLPSVVEGYPNQVIYRQE